MGTDSDSVICRTPTSGKDGTTRIPAWKYDCIRRAIFDVLEEREDHQINFKDLPKAVKDRLTTNQLAKLGSVGWHVTTVKLNMEVEGELRRIHGAKPQRLERSFI